MAQNFLVKGHTHKQVPVQPKDERVTKLENAYNELVDILSAYPVNSANGNVGPNSFFKKLSVWMAWAIVSKALDLSENNIDNLNGLNIDDICKLPDDVKGLNTLVSVIPFIDSLSERAKGCDGFPFKNWSVCDIVGTVRSESFDSYSEELLNYVVTTPVPGKK